MNKDSADYYITKVSHESSKINYINGIARSHIQRSGFANHFLNDYRVMEIEAKTALHYFDKTANKKFITVAYWQIGYAKSRQGQYDSAILYLDRSNKWANETGEDFFVGSNFETLTDIYRERGDYVKLLESQQKLIDRERKNGDTGYYSFHELWVLGVMYKLMGEYETAIPFWRKLFIEIMGGKIWSWNLMEYAELFTRANQDDSAIFYFNKFDSARADPRELRFFLTSKGEYYLFHNEYARALPYFAKALIFHRRANDLPQIKRTMLDIAKSYMVLQRDDSAKSYARESLNMALQTNSKPSIRDSYEILYRIYDREDKKDSAYYYYHSFIDMKEAVMNDQTKGKLAAYNYEHKIEKMDHEKIAQQQQLVQTNQQKRYLVIGIIGIVVLALFVLRNILLKRNNETARRKLVENQLQLQKMEAEQTEFQLLQQKNELEMQALRAQMNPHFIFNSLNSINRFILENNRLQASQYLTKFSKLVRLILQNSQSALIPLESELEALQLYLELEKLRFDHHFDYHLNVEEGLDLSALKVPPLIIQPYAENAIWHGLMPKREKGHLGIGIQQQDDLLICTITDNGIGRKKASELKTKSVTTHKSMGMRITADRIAMLQRNDKSENYVMVNDLVLPNGLAAGTEVMLKIPLV
jgi:tetratricopeptide (TPR) repeat protein